MICPIYEFVIPLITGHVLGDFLIQTDKDNEKKDPKKILLKHSIIIGLLSYLLTGIIQAWPIFFIIFLFHLMTDYIKSRIKERSLRIFVYDQLAHLAIIFGLSLVLTSRDLFTFPSLWVQYLGNSFYSLLIILTGAIVCVNVCGIVVGFCVKPFLDQIKETAKSSSTTSAKSRDLQSRGLKDGGKIIGYLERALIYLFVAANQPTAIGFLIAAKSVFRFGEVKERANRMEAEYIIIGTLYSFLSGLLVSYAVKWILSVI
jgi:hypothetical protein